ncbi:MAG TPA: hypothetical protein VMZ31_05865 [Phycisphaerae bacterium]|nr:hypothetical protein [Phycisphaerae bacterium]
MPLDANGNEIPPAPPAPPATKDPETFSREYVSELRNENKGWRLKAAEMEGKAKTEAEARTKAEADAAAKITEANQVASQRILMSEMKAHALAAGMVDLDGLKLADLSTVKLNDKGEVEGAEALFKALKEAKPYLFKEVKSTSSTGEPPKPKPGTKTGGFKDMTPEQQTAELRRRGVPV